MEGMSLEVIQEIAKTAVTASGAIGKLLVQEAPQLGPGKVLLVGPNGTYTVEQKTSPRTRRLGTLGSLVEWVNYAVENLTVKPVLWVARGGVRCVLDDKDHDVGRDVVECGLEKTPQYSWLLGNMKEPATYEQKKFLVLLRTKLWDCLDSRPSRVNANRTMREDLLTAIKSLSYENGVKGRSDVGTGKHSFGSDIEKSVTSKAGELPEEIELQVRLFSDETLNTPRTVTACLDYDLDGARPQISLSVRESDMADALDEELKDIVGLLSQAVPPEVKVFRGEEA